MLKNKHVIAALIITPILSVLGYFAVDALVSETPRAAVAGSSYELVARPSCRYTSGHCTLVNGDFEIGIEGTLQTDGRLLLSLKSAFPLRKGMLAVVDSGVPGGAPKALLPEGDDRMNWTVVVPAPISAESVLRLAVSANDSWYFGESIMAFIHYETGFGKDFRGSE